CSLRRLRSEAIQSFAGILCIILILQRHFVPERDPLMKMTRYLLKSTITGALGGLLFGFDTAVIPGTTQQLSAVYNLTSFTLGLTVSIGLVGTVVGAMSAGVVGQRIGGREALRILAVLYTISALGCALAWNWPALMVFRFIGGLGVGGSSVLG